jgi:hypothetical protein
VGAGSGTGIFAIILAVSAFVLARVRGATGIQAAHGAVPEASAH